jgi:hypothetical protein
MIFFAPMNRRAGVASVYGKFQVAAALLEPVAETMIVPTILEISAGEN